MTERTATQPDSVERIDFIPTDGKTIHDIRKSTQNNPMTLCELDVRECIRFEVIGIYGEYLALATQSVSNEIESDVQLDSLKIGVVYKIDGRNIVVWGEINEKNGSPRLFMGVPEPEKVTLS